MEHSCATFTAAILRSLDRINAACQGMEPGALAWRPNVPNANSLGMIATHSIGNAEDRVLGIAFQQPLAPRDRAAEFEAPLQSARAIAARLDDVRRRVEGVAADYRVRLTDERDHPERGRVSVLEVLLHAARHAAEHAGEAELTRRLWEAAHS